jgi:hypothetical protein
MSGEEPLPARDKKEQQTCKYFDDPHQVASEWIEGYELV